MAEFQEIPLEFPSLPDTYATMEMCIAAIDRQLDEIEDRVTRLKVTRGALASLVSKNRKGDTPTTRMLDGASRAQYEPESSAAGETEDRRVPRRVGAA